MTATATDLTVLFHGPRSTGVLHLLFLTTSEAANEIEIEPRIKNFMSTIKPAKAPNLIMLVDEGGGDGLHGLMTLQLLLFDFGNPPVIMAYSANQVLPLLEKHIKQLERPTHSIPHPIILPTTLVAHATSSAPTKILSDHDANVLTDLFPSIRELEEGTRTVIGQQSICKYLDAKTAREVIEFWDQEWLV